MNEYVIFNVYGVSFLQDEKNVLEMMVVMAAQSYECI